MGLYDAEGKVELFGQELNFKDTRSVLSAGVAMVSEDRKGVGLLLDRSIEDNIVFNAMQIKGEYLKKFGPFTQIDSKKIRETEEEYIKSLDIRCFGPTQHSAISRILVFAVSLVAASFPSRRMVMLLDAAITSSRRWVIKIMAIPLSEIFFITEISWAASLSVRTAVGSSNTRSFTPVLSISRAISIN